jgi:hypothetical protein
VRLSLVVLTAAVVVACQAPAVLTPDRTDWPCHDYHSRQCSTASGGGCCYDNEICGHDELQDPTHTCPVGMCCYDGLAHPVDVYTAAPGGAPAIVPVIPPLLVHPRLAP